MTGNKIKIGIIGGSGLDNPQILDNFKEIEMPTPFHKPSSAITEGKIGGTEVVILARHGKLHSLMPTQVPYHANMWALKELGCTHIIATTACGSLREDFKPGHFVFLDQFIDHTKHRPITFFKDKVIHTPMADPFCKGVRNILIIEAKKLGLLFHHQGTIVTIEGPRFSTRAESKMFQKWGADVVNMSTVPEIILARELSLCYQGIAMVTDYDCWKEDEKPVTWEIVIERMKNNSENVKKLLIETIKNMNFPDCDCIQSVSEVRV